MTELLHNWIMGLTGASIVAAGALCLSPNRAVDRVLRLLCALMLLFCLFSPMTEPDTDGYALSLAEYRASAAMLCESLEERTQLLDRAFIERECEAYILDEAESLNMRGSAEVRAKWQNACFVPWEAELTMTGEGKATLSAWLEGEMGIPKERQYWHEGA